MTEAQFGQLSKLVVLLNVRADRCLCRKTVIKHSPVRLSVDHPSIPDVVLSEVQCGISPCIQGDVLFPYRGSISNGPFDKDDILTRSHIIERK